jgi:hypothetical protein
MTPGDNERRLLALVGQWRDEECLKLLDRARDEALELLRNTHRRGRRHLRRAVLEERERNRSSIAAAEAELETLRRRHRQQLGSVILTAARKRLPDRLAEQWADPRMRGAWIRNAARQALARLPPPGRAGRRWTVRHAFCFQAADFDTLLQALKPGLAGEPELISDMNMEAGLVIACGGVSLDASAAGLLSDTDTVHARLLALMETDSNG